jgi:cysteine desulfurase
MSEPPVKSEPPAHSELPLHGGLPLRSELPVYLDNAATTPVDPRVAARMSEVLTSSAEFGNPASSSHGYGHAAAAAIETARAQVAAAVGAEADEVIWTSGATESNNLAIFGVAHYYRDHGRHIVTARTEHKAVLDPCAELERRGWRVTYLTPAQGGVIDPRQLAAALRPDTVLVSLMHVNNEIGVVQDIAAMAEICAAHGNAWLHVDAAQSVGKCSVDFAAFGVHLMSLSAHKVYGPKGAGALLVSKRGARGHAGTGAGVHLTALQLGGGQERGVRSGTLATHQIVGMGLAFQLASEMSSVESRRIADLRDRLWRGLVGIGGVLRNGAPQHVVPNLLNVSFEGVEGESLLAAVSPRIAVSTGSACTSATQEASYVLRALGRSEILSESSLRFSLGRFTEPRDVDAAIAVLTEAVPRLRRIAGAGATA